MHLDAFLELKAPDGKNLQFEILTFHHGGFRENKTAPTTSEEGGTEAGQWTYREVTVMLPIDEHYWRFVRGVCNGERFASAEIRFRHQVFNPRKPTEETIKPFVLKMQNVIVTRLKYVTNPVFHQFGRGVEIPILPGVAEKLGPLMEIEFMYFGNTPVWKRA